MFWSISMRLCLRFTGLAVLCLAPLLRADEPKKAEAKPHRVPYRLTETKHVMVRAKINGKGPYNFIIDTGAPALFVSTALCKKLGVEPDNKGWGTFDRFDLEGGVALAKVKGRVETPFQLEGMNGLGLAGAELHGIIGYTVLARYRMEIDFTKDKMVWTPLDFKPPLPQGLGGAGAPGGMDAMAGLMKMAGAFLGKKARPESVPRGFLGIELGDADKSVTVKSVLAKGPAAGADLKPGDRISHFQGKEVKSTADIQKLAAKLPVGEKVQLTVIRDGEKHQVAVKAGEGL